MNRPIRVGTAIWIAALCTVTTLLLISPASRAGVRPTAAQLADEGRRYSDMGPDGQTQFFGQWPAVAYNSVEHEFLVVWAGHDGATDPLMVEEEIFGQRIDAATGAEIGENDFRISDMGPNNAPGYDVRHPDVIFNPDDNEYLVVWTGDDIYGPIENELEIYGQRLDGATGEEVGVNDFRISVTGSEGNEYSDAFMPSVTYNGTVREYLVVWYSDHGVNNKMIIFGQRLDALSGTEIGADDFQISDMGPASNASYDARSPRVAYNPLDDEYLVVWYGNDNIPPLTVGEVEVFGQRLNGADATPIGANDFRISDMGPDGDGTFDVLDGVDVAYNPNANEYLVVWNADDIDLGDEEFEVFGQRLAGGTGNPVGRNDVRLTDVGPADELGYDASHPRVVYNPVRDVYLIVWFGDDNSTGSVNDEFEIFAQWLTPDLRPTTANHTRVSAMGPAANLAFAAERPKVAIDIRTGDAFVVWHGDTNTNGLVDDEFEVYGTALELRYGPVVFPVIVRGE